MIVKFVRILNDQRGGNWQHDEENEGGQDEGRHAVSQPTVFIHGNCTDAIWSATAVKPGWIALNKAADTGTSCPRAYRNPPTVSS
jgi:hypothetical protein